MITSLFHILTSPLAALQNQNHSTLSKFKNDIISAYKPLTKGFDAILIFSAVYILLSIDGSLDAFFGQDNMVTISNVIDTTLLLTLISAFFIQSRINVLLKTTTALLSEKEHQKNNSLPSAAQANWHNQIPQKNNLSTQGKSHSNL